MKKVFLAKLALRAASTGQSQGSAQAFCVADGAQCQRECVTVAVEAKGRKGFLVLFLDRTI